MHWEARADMLRISHVSGIKRHESMCRVTCGDKYSRQKEQCVLKPRCTYLKNTACSENIEKDMGLEKEKCRLGRAVQTTL